MGLINELNEYRLKNKITQEKLAEMLKVKHQTVWRWFHDKAQPNQIQEYAIKRLLDK